MLYETAITAKDIRVTVSVFSLYHRVAQSVGYAILFFYLTTLLAVTVTSVFEKKNDLTVSPMEGKSYVICLTGCFITSAVLAIWLYTLGGSEDGAAAGIAVYYINGVRVSGGAMFLPICIFTAFLFWTLGSMLTSFLAHIPVFILVNRSRRKLNAALERKRVIAVLLWFFFSGFNIHLIYLGLLDLFLIRFAVLLASAVFSGFKAPYIGVPLFIVWIIWWLFDFIYILKCKEKFYAAHIHWMKS
jgi:hypothetical protein